MGGQNNEVSQEQPWHNKRGSQQGGPQGAEREQGHTGHQELGTRYLQQFNHETQFQNAGDEKSETRCRS